MARIWLSLSLAYAFLWRFIIIASIQMAAQYNYVNIELLSYKKDTMSLLIYLGALIFFIIFPFFLTMYWMLVGGALYRITIKYTADYVPKKYFRSLCYRIYQMVFLCLVYCIKIINKTLTYITGKK